MKERLVFLVLLTFLWGGCSSTNVQDEPVKKNEPKKIEKPAAVPETGWSDRDTYTVRVTGADEKAAKARARHKILKDIVNVRVLNGSMYIDITKIADEFDKPLKGGKVIHKNRVSGGVEIFFQIRDKGLKKKFQRR